MALENIGAERGLLAILIKHPTLIFTTKEFVKAEDFSDTCYKNIYRVIEALATDHDKVIIDEFLITSKASEIGIKDFDESHDVEMYKALDMSISDPSNLEKFIKSVATAAIKRNFDEILSASKEYLRETNDGPTKVVASLENKILGQVDRLNGEDNQPKKGGEGFLEWANELADNPDQELWSTCFPRYDEMVGKARRNSLHIISARPKVGKSFMGLNIAVDMAKRDIPVLITDTELSYEQWRLRFASNMSGVPMNVIESGKWKGDKEYIKKLKEASESMSKLPIYHKDVVGLSIQEILSVMRSWLYREVGFDAENKSNRCVFIHDYIKLQDAGDMEGGLTEWQALGFACTQMKNFAGKYSTCIYSFAQLNRENTIAASDRINWYASSVANFHLKTAEEIEEDGPKRGNRKMIVKFSRHGEPHDENDALFFNFDGAVGQIKEDKNRSEMLREINGNNN